MISIVLAIILGIGFTILATQNPSSVTLNFFDSNLTLPIYAVVALSFLIGIAIAMLFHLFDLGVAQIDIDKQNKELKDYAKDNNQLRSQVNNLNSQNERLKQELAHLNSRLREERISTAKQNVKNFFGRIKHSAAS